MSYDDIYHPTDNTDFSVISNELKKLKDTVKHADSGYNVIWRMLEKNEVMKKTKIGIYTSKSYGCHIRDAETGHYYTNCVGSSDEDLYFKVVLATGECKSRNNSSTMFYSSPRHYMSHMRCDLDPNQIAKWEVKRDARVAEAEKSREAMRFKRQIVYVN